MEIQDGSAKFKTEYNPIMPNGSIITFSGSFTEEGYPIDNQTGVVYTNWHVCNGEEGTVDLRGKFILGSNSTHSVGEVGGEETHTLSVAEMPSHSHSINCDLNDETWVMGVMPGVAGGTDTLDFSGGWQRGISWTVSIVNSGGSQPHNNMPPYYALAYMQKI